MQAKIYEKEEEKQELMDSIKEFALVIIWNTISSINQNLSNLHPKFQRKSESNHKPQVQQQHPP